MDSLAGLSALSALQSYPQSSIGLSAYTQIPTLASLGGISSPLSGGIGNGTQAMELLLAGVLVKTLQTLSSLWGGVAGGSENNGNTSNGYGYGDNQSYGSGSGYTVNYNEPNYSEPSYSEPIYTTATSSPMSTPIDTTTTTPTSTVTY